jgi:hypothetical protein
MKKVFCRSKFLSSPFTIRCNIVLGITRLLCLAEVPQRFLASCTPGHGSAYSPIEYRPKIWFRACVTVAERIGCSQYRNMWLNISSTWDPTSSKKSTVVNSRIHAQQPAIMIDVVRGLRQCLQTNVVIAHQIRALLLPSEPSLLHKPCSILPAEAYTMSYWQRIQTYHEQNKTKWFPNFCKDKLRMDAKLNTVRYILYWDCFNFLCNVWVSVCGGVLTIVWVFW